MEQEKRAWWKEAVIYQIYPRSFADSNGDGIGDLNGITEHLDYLSELGIDVIWLSPVYQSPNDDNGYDISDYRAIMADFGTMADFDRLLTEAHARHIRIVMDLVVNHTSDEHPWFIESRKSKDNPYRDYYIWKDPRDGGAPNKWASCFSGPAWQYDEQTGQYYLHCFSRKQPDLNWDNPKVRDEVFDLMDWWCQKGIDGFRMDVISMISKHPDFPDGPVHEDGYSDMFAYVCNGPHVHEYLQEMNRRVLSRYDLLTVGEAAGVTVEEAKKYANSAGTELGMVFHFEHTDGAANSEAVIGKWTKTPPKMPYVRKILNKWQTELEGKAWDSLYWDNHDQPRAVSRFGNDAPKWREKSAKMLATVLHMQKGTPYIYQGEEIGMTNMHFHSVADCADIEEKNAWQELVVQKKLVDGKTLLACFDTVARDNARTPMQWDDTQNAGFTAGTPWLAVNPNYKAINVKAALADKESVFYYYQQLIKLRHMYPIIVYGRFRPLLEDSEEIYAYARELDGQVLTMVANWTEREVPCALLEQLTGKELISNYAVHKNGCLQPYEARVFLTDEN